MDNDQWRREVEYKLKDKEREISSENDRGEERELKGFEKEDMKAEKEQKRDKPEPKQRPYRKMWLEPRADRERTKTLQEEYGEREKDRERYAQRHEEEARERYAQSREEKARERYAKRHVEKARERYAQIHEEEPREKDAQRHEEEPRERDAQIHEEEPRERYTQRHEEEPRERYAQSHEEELRERYAQRHEEEPRERYAQRHEEKEREIYAQSHEEEPKERYAQRHEEEPRERYAQRHEEKEREIYAQSHEEEPRERYAQRHEEKEREIYAQSHEEEPRERYAQSHEEEPRERYAQRHEEEARERYAQRHEEEARERYAQRHKEQETPRNEEDTSADQTCQVLQTLAEDDEQDIDAEFMTDESERRVSNESIEPDDQGEFDASYQIEAEHLADRMEGCHIEEESGSERCGQSDREEDSEGEWEERREKITSGDDGFVTVSSGLDDDEADEDTFEDCKEFWDSGNREDRCRQSPTGSLEDQGEIETRMAEVRGDHKVTVFCVVGQTLPRSGSHQNPSTDDLEQEQASELLPYQMGDEGYQDTVPISDKETEKDTDHRHGLTLPEENNMDSAEYDKVTTDPAPQEEAVIVTDDMHTEKENNVHTAPSVTSTETDDHETHPEKREKRHYLKQAEGTAQEKRISAPPHVKWAKNVLSEILGSSEDGTLNIPEPGDGVPSEAEGLRSPALPLYGVVHKPHKHRRDVDPESSHTNTDTLVQNEIPIHVERDSEEEEEPEQPRPEVETDEEAEYYNLTSPDLNSLSSEGEGEKEESSKKNKKQKKKTVWQMISSSSLRDLGHEALGRRRKGIRRTVQKQKDEAKEEEAGRDRRTRVFPPEDEYDDLSSTWSEMDLSAIKGTISRSRTRNSKYYNSQLYQQYSEVVQNRELLHQSSSDSVFVEVIAPHISSSSPCPSPPLARRPLPPLPPALHSHSVPHTNSVSSLNESLAVPHSSLPRPSSPLRSRSFASSPMLWQDLPGVKNNPETKNLSQDERRLQEVRFEVVTSEASYCSSLDIVVEHFVKSKQLNSYLASQDKNWLFSRLCDVRALSHSFFTQLEGRVESNIMHFTVCDLIIKHCPRFRAAYVPYLTNQSYQDKTYQRLINENSGFRHTVETLEQSPRCQRLPFRSFLILPFQRITRLKLLVQNILKRTAPKSKEEAQAIKAMKLLEKMIQDSNDSITQMKSIESLVSLNAKVDFECKTLPLISQSRRLVREGAVTELRDFAIKERERTVYIHLFNDYLLVSLPRESGRFTVIDHAPVSELRAENCNVKLLSLSKNVFRLHLANRSLILRTDSQADKLRWISALSRPHPEIDFNSAQDCAQMQCIRAIIAQQPDELSLEKADVLLVLQQSVDGWVEGTRLSDRLRGWVPKTHLEIIKSDKARQSNLIDALKITTATATD
ncbi:trichohyalin [Trichomycterus rosablanca]|uniref:trichohyalin n=1 Tax=Trichomycterus rosablanca TaxID=2290929 RepID=UPI002F358334